MSFLLLKSPGIDPRKEAISARRDSSGEDSLKEFLQGSFRSIPSQNHKPLCALHGGRREDLNGLDGYIAGLKELQTGIFEWDGQKQIHGTAQAARRDSAYAEDEQVQDDYLVEELVSKIVSQFRLVPECSKARPHDLGTECKKQSLQDPNVCASDNDILEDESSSASSGDFLVHAGEEEGLLLPQSVEKIDRLSIESSVGPTKLKSALRGGNEKQGLGPRPKLHVTWAPDVYDPPCTSTSHTSSQNHKKHHRPPRSDHHKSRHHKGKASNHADAHKKPRKKPTPPTTRRLKHPGEAFTSGLLTAVAQRDLLDSTSFWKECVPPSLDDVISKST